MWFLTMCILGSIFIPVVNKILIQQPSGLPIGHVWISSFKKNILSGIHSHITKRRRQKVPHEFPLEFQPNMELMGYNKDLIL